MLTNTLLIAALVAGAAQAATIPATDRTHIKHAAINKMKRDNMCFPDDPSNAPLNQDASYCTSYCENVNQQITGPPQQVGAVINCDTATCTDLHSETFTATQSFSFSVGITLDTNAAEEDTLKAGASIGADWSWSKSEATSDSFSFSLVNGDSGYVVFRPYYQQSCGSMTYWDWDVYECNADTENTDPNVCGQTPILINNFADGEFTFCYTAGPSAGQGC